MRIIINNLLSVRNAEFELNKINIIVGRQASGKSIIAKIAFFAKEIDYIFARSIYISTYEKFRKEIYNLFFSIFPKYTLENSNYYVKIVTNSYELDISKNNKFIIKFNDRYKNEYNKMRKYASEFLKNKVKISFDKTSMNFDGGTINYKDNIIQTSIVHFVSRQIFKHDVTGSNVYIPATRTLVSVLEKNFFSLFNKINFDPILQSFGMIYESTKIIYNNKIRDSKDKDISYINRIIKSVMCGSYERRNDKDYIVQNESSNELIHSSSGQQSAFPLLIGLIYPFVNMSLGHLLTTIEEPESHLFPEAQKDIVNLIAYICNVIKGSQYIVTTHSPYVLTSLNNLIYAGSIYKNYPQLENSISKIIPKSVAIIPESISSFCIHNGELISIMDHDTGLIDSQYIDSISEYSSIEFDALLEATENVN